MKPENLIPIDQFCNSYKIEISFLQALNEVGLVEIYRTEKNAFLEEEQIGSLEKMVRLHHDLGVNVEGIDIITNLLHRIEEMELRMLQIKNRLRIYED